jgi:hypothetical protein
MRKILFRALIIFSKNFFQRQVRTMDKYCSRMFDVEFFKNFARNAKNLKFHLAFWLS